MNKLLVKTKLLEEEAKRMTMKPKVNTDTATAFSSHKKYQHSKWKEKGASPFPYNWYNCGMRGHKRSDCRKRANFSGNYREGYIIIEMNIAVVSTVEAVTFVVNNVSMEVTMVEINIKEDGGIKNEVLSVQKRPQLKEGQAIHTHFLLRLVIVKCI
jgi:hypothetical protein